MHTPNTGADHPALENFDINSGSRLERLVFNSRRIVMIVCLVLTVLFATLAGLKLTLNASFEKMIPAGTRTSRTT
jgi:predicted RND superfamily exporter protein